MNQLATVFVAVLATCGVLAATPSQEEAMMRLRESSLEGLKESVESPGTGVVYMGTWKEWHRFYFSYERRYDDVISRGHGEFRCKNLKLVSVKGDLAGCDLPFMARVMAVDLERRSVVLDVEGAKDDLRRAIEETEKELSNLEGCVRPERSGAVNTTIVEQARGEPATKPQPAKD
jgi:hypothetical protein